MERVRVGLIPAAGEGRRMGYLSQILPKCLFPLSDKPIIHHITENMKGIGVEQAYIIVNYQKEKVMEYFKQVRDGVGMDIGFIEQERLSGIADAIMLGKDLIHEPFTVILGDDCTLTPSLGNLVRLFFQRRAVVVEGVVREPDEGILKSTCCLNLDAERRIVKIEEKPQNPFSPIRGCGVYIFDPAIFQYIAQTPPSPLRNEMEITHTIARVAQDGKAYGEFIDGVNKNINSYEDLLHAWILMQQLKGHPLPSF